MYSDQYGDSVSLDALQNQVLLVLGIMAALVIVPYIVAWARRQAWWPAVVRVLAPVLCVVGCCVWLPVAWVVRRVVAPVDMVISWVRMRIDPAAEKRRKLGRYLAALPPHSGLTYYEEMANDIAALPPGPAKMAMQAYFRKVAPPAAAQVAKARRLRGKPRVARGMVNALLRGDIPYAMRPQSVINPDSIVALAARGCL